MENRSQYPDTAAFPSAGYGPNPQYGAGIPPHPQQPFNGTLPRDVPIESAWQQRPGDPRPKRRFGPVKIALIIVFSPFIGLWFAVKALFWSVTWLLAPLLVAAHLVIWPLGCAWFGLVRLCGARGRSRFRMFRPIMPRFPALLSGSYWMRARGRVKTIFEVLFTIGEFLGDLLGAFN